MGCHVADSFRMATGEKPVRDASTALRRTVLKWVVLCVPLRWPSGILTSPEIDQVKDAGAPIEFAAEVSSVPPGASTSCVALAGGGRSSACFGTDHLARGPPA